MSVGRHFIGLSTALAILIVTGCADLHDWRASRSAIVDGRAAGPADARGVVALVERRTRAVFCTGTHVSPGVVITAAHCLDGMSEAEIADRGALLGELEPGRSSSPIARITGVHLHPDFPAPLSSDPTTLGADHDIAVLVVEDFPSNAESIPMLDSAASDDALVSGTALTIAGYGQTRGGDHDRGTLRVGQTTLSRRTEDELLAGEGDSADTCFGDSGGPAFLDLGGQRWLAGVTARVSGTSEEQCGGGTIFTAIPPHLPFVEAAAASSPDSAGCTVSPGRRRPQVYGGAMLAGAVVAALSVGRRRRR